MHLSKFIFFTFAWMLLCSNAIESFDHNFCLNGDHGGERRKNNANLQKTGFSDQKFSLLKQKTSLSEITAPSNKEKEMMLRSYLLGMERSSQKRDLLSTRRHIEEQCMKNAQFVHFRKPEGKSWTIVALMLAIIAMPFLGWFALAPRADGEIGQ